MTGICRVIVAFSIVMVGCKNAPKDVSASPNENGPEITKIQLKDLNDQPINLDKYKGKAIFINFWATWCQPCLAEMPSIEKAQDILQNENVVFLLASNETVTEIQEFQNARGYKFNYARIENSEELGILALPTTYIFNPDGKLIFSEQGYRKWDEKDNILLIRKISSNND